MAKKPLWTWEVCAGSGYPPYRYIPGKTDPKRSKGKRIDFARAICEVCQTEQPVNVNRRLRKHYVKVQLYKHNLQEPR